MNGLGLFGLYASLTFLWFQPWFSHCDYHGLVNYMLCKITFECGSCVYSGTLISCRCAWLCADYGRAASQRDRRLPPERVRRGRRRPDDQRQNPGTFSGGHPHVTLHIMKLTHVFSAGLI